MKFPIKSSNIKPQPLPESKDSDKQLNGIKALIVDDEPDARELLAFILEEQGAEVELANSAETALHKLKSFVPDILISDIGNARRRRFKFVKESSSASL